VSVETTPQCEADDRISELQREIERLKAQLEFVGEHASGEGDRREAVERDLRSILRAWGLGNADEMNAYMLLVFLREFGKAPDVGPPE